MMKILYSIKCSRCGINCDLVRVTTRSRFRTIVCRDCFKAMENEKRCSKCKEVLPLDQFYYSRGRYFSACKTCLKLERSREITGEV
jgi:hypothetical protein